MVKNECSVGGSKKTPIGYKVAPRKRTVLRSISDQLRALPDVAACYKNEGVFLDAVYLLENLLPRAGFNLHVLDDDQLKETAGFTIPEAGLIVLRASIYDGLFEDEPFSRYTVVHEFSHIILKHAASLHRGATLGEHSWYEDSEWQANNLAAELMMPVDVIQRLDCKPLLIMGECGVSASATHFRLDNLRKEGLIK
ncbi:ImmA/IrrE family metallo-endopeptidase [Duganella sp. BJB488]|uniref:ImmA/IrrE family metallo-endopeptidase n=1 Tax=unclassified Duganella TaxID=2636909 RepID=UPI000E34AB5A|nr:MULTISPECIES: ImmA/IrrE family metallo-endopeptidase [unclassified Duganella]RFP24555.1 ImmA/IrrE family metallo-endopeptidase [Duganella sp. BJB489]RFP26915.1 ImmA/IrrE family metallo-endopeptidase [Duganella sp. BJB488]RFP34352.1 ImmA/IrrE family metallo-endopeptidase [Duganella sp. BJB480]